MDERLKAMALDSPASDSAQSPTSLPAKPIVTITFSSRRKPPSFSPQLSTTLPKEIPCEKQGAADQPEVEPPSSSKPAGRELAQQPSPTFCKVQEEYPQSGPEQRKQLTSETSGTRQTLAETSELPSTGTPTGQKPCSTSPDAPTSSRTRTVLSHVRVTLSPKRPAAFVAHPSDIPLPSAKLHLSAVDAHVAGEDLGPQLVPSPPHLATLDVSCPFAPQPAGQGPPYPPLPMPIPAFYPTFSPLFDYCSEVRPEPRIPIVQDSSKVDVSTQTARSHLPVTAATTSQTVVQEVSAQTERTELTVSTRATSSQALVTQGTDVPVMLPYKPAGSTKLFYMPDSGTRSKIDQLDSESSSESLRADSQDGPPTRIPTEVLGTRGYIPSSKLTRHRERAYGKAAAPKKPRNKEEMKLLERGIRCHQSSLAPGAATLPENLPLQHASHGDLYADFPVQYDDRNPLESWNRRLSCYPKTRQRAREREPSGRRSRSYPTVRQTVPTEGGIMNPVWPLATGETQSHWAEEEEGRPARSYSEWAKAAARGSRHGNPRGQPCPATRYTDLAGSAGPPAEPTGGLPSAKGAVRYSSLDELWEKFKERQKRHKSLGSSSASELSLLERLDQLARFLRNPVQHSLLSVEGVNGWRGTEERERRRRAWEDTVTVGPAAPSPGSLCTPKSESLVSLEEISTERIKNILNRQRYSDTKSGSSGGPPVTESDTTASTETDLQTQTETGSTTSTIDTVRLVRAFGPERVTVKPLSRLYGTIEKQKESSVRRRDWPRRAETRCQSASGDWQVSGGLGVTVSVTTPDCTSTASASARPSHGPSSKLVSKRSTRLVNQGVQTESLEIVPSAKGRRTRDMGVTFPSPDSDVTLHRTTAPRSHRWGLVSPTTNPATSSAKDRRKKGSSHTQRGPGKGGRTSAGPAWFIPANELKWDSRKENVPEPGHSPDSRRFELLPSTTPWRVPLREKHVQEQWVSDRVKGWSPESVQDDAAVKYPSSLIRLTLKEALHMNRPDFISQSRERVRRLELLMEERKMQSILQSERERLFNQHPERGPRDWKGHELENSIFSRKKIPKREMFDRSKRRSRTVCWVRKSPGSEQARMSVKVRS
ncbi:centrosome-associated protein ALMS1-like isoform X2 [Heterodontus francisci]|uniref:centrosome-associated protein ALMS1-like isoform X2 n=1 Tax=Heterodontus francisci TaxID=7792 RepID=UPI00355C67DE